MGYGARFGSFKMNRFRVIVKIVSGHLHAAVKSAASRVKFYLSWLYSHQTVFILALDSSMTYYDL